MKKSRGPCLMVFLLALSLRASAADGGDLEFFSSVLEAGARDVELSGDLAYAIYFTGLIVVDYGDPANPVQVGKFLMEESPLDLRLSGDLCVVADSTAGILVIDVSDPTRPDLIGRYETNIEAMGLDLRGDTLYVANGSRGLVVLSLADPAAPAFIADLTGIGPTWGVDAGDEYAYLAALQNGLDVVRIGDLPNLDHLYRVSEPPCLNLAVDVEATSTHAYLANGHYLAAVDLTGLPGGPPDLVSCTYTTGRALDVFIDFPLLYLADDVAGLHIYDIGTTPGRPAAISVYDTPDDARGVAEEGGIAVVADDFGAPAEFAGLLFLDVSNPESPDLLGTYPSGGECHGGVVDGDIAYVGQGTRGLAVVDAGEPFDPRIIASFSDSIGFVHSLDVSDTLLAAANGSRGLMLLDVSDPSSPAYLGEVEPGLPGQRATRVKISGEVAYVVDGDLHAVDISDPVSPFVVSSYVSPTDFEDLALAGDLAFVTDGDGVIALDVSQPLDTLRWLGRLSTPGTAAGVDARNGILYVADREGGLRVIRYEASGAMEELGWIDLGDEARDVAVRDDVAFVGLGGGGVAAVDVGDPGSPLEMDRFPTPGWWTESVEVGETLILACDLTSAIFLGYATTGIGRGDRDGPPVPSAPSIHLSQNRPNPFNPETSIAFQIPATDRGRDGRAVVSVEVFSMRGRWIKEICREPAGAGEHVVRWDGTNADGEPVPSGVYIYVLKAGGFRAARKMVLVR